jgi:hypothetical protein
LFSCPFFQPPMSNPTISQDLLPVHFARRDIPLTRSSLSKSSAAIGLEQFKHRTHVGVATQTSQDGRVKRLALATGDAVLLISVDQSALRTRDAVLADLLQAGPMLLGFGMAHIALEIHRALKIHVGNGIDLSTLCSPSTREPWAPSKVVSNRLWTPEDSRKIDRLWYNADDSSEREVALRAWISAMYKFCRRTEKYADPTPGSATHALRTSRRRRKSTRETYNPRCASLTSRYINLDCPHHRQELTVFEHLLAQVDALAANKPRETPNDFVGHVMTADGGMKLTNARYQTRVRRSQQVRREMCVHIRELLKESDADFCHNDRHVRP